MNKENLPKFTKNQRTGVTASSLLKSIMSRFSLINEIEQSQDVGLYLSSNKDIFDYSIKTSTINYWRQKNDPTFLFFVDIEDEVLYWVDNFTLV
ncbi:MAG: hypothetical protein ACRCXQ_06220 [Vagococcus fluvialis]